MAIIPIAEEVAASTGFLTWLSRSVGLAAPLADLLFGHGHSEPARNDAIGPAAAFIQAPAVIMHDMFGQLVSGFQGLYNTLNAMKADYRNRAASVLHQAQHMYNLNRAYAYQQSQVVLGKAQHLYNQALSVTSGWVNAEAKTRAANDLTVLHEAQHLYNLSLATASGWVTAEGHTRAAGDLDVLHQAQHLYNLGRTYADTTSTQAAARSSAKLSSDSADALAPSYQGIRQDLEAAAAVFGVGQPGITALIKQLPSTAPANLPGAEAATGKALRVLTKTMEDCVAPNCRDTSKFGKDLQSLFGLVEGAAFLAFLAFIIKDPDDAVRETFDTLDGLTHTIIDGARHLVGM